MPVSGSMSLSISPSGAPKREGQRVACLKLHAQAVTAGAQVSEMIVAVFVADGLRRDIRLSVPVHAQERQGNALEPRLAVIPAKPFPF